MPIRNLELDRLKYDVIDRYVNDLEGTVSIGKSIGLNSSTIERRLHSWGVPVRKKGGAYPLRHGAFDILTPESMYWIGYLAGDGYVTHRADGYTNRLGLSSKDRPQIEKFVDFLGLHRKALRHRVVNKFGGQFHEYSAKITSENIVRRLIGYGIVPRKSMILEIKESELLRSVDFIRGVVDSDGCVTVVGKDRTPRVNIGTGSTVFRDQMIRAIMDVFGISARWYPNRTISIIHVGGRSAVALMCGLYTNVPRSISLDRKRTMAMAISGEQRYVR